MQQAELQQQILLMVNVVILFLSIVWPNGCLYILLAFRKDMTSLAGMVNL